MTAYARLNIVRRMTSSLVLIGLGVGLFTGVFLARATAARTNVRTKKTGATKARKELWQARTAWWKALGLAVALGALTILYVVATGAGDTSSTGQ